LDDEPGLSGGLVGGLTGIKGLAVGVVGTRIATGVVTQRADFTAKDLASEQPTEVVVTTTTPTRARVTSVTSAIAMTRR
jgi:hypothetical protein